MAENEIWPMWRSPNENESVVMKYGEISCYSCCLSNNDWRLFVSSGLRRILNDINQYWPNEEANILMLNDGDIVIAIIGKWRNAILVFSDEGNTMIMIMTNVIILLFS